MDAPRSFKVEVIADASGKWAGNGQRFVTREDAEHAARNLAARWFLVRDWRVVESEDAPNYTWADGRAKAIEVAA